MAKGGEGVELVAQVVLVALVVRWCNSNIHLLLQVALYDAAVAVVGIGIDQVLSCQS